MGGVASAIGSIGGAASGLALGGMPGALLGGGLGNALGGGGGLSSMLGINNGFNANAVVNPDEYNKNIQAGQSSFNQNQANQGALASALLAQSQGQGPNPAQAMLNQATQRNIQQGAGLISSQKGINPGLAGRQAAEMSSNLNQQAAGQGAVMNAQQQLAAQQQLGNVYGQQGMQNLQNQNMNQQALLNSALGSQRINADISSGNTQRNSQLIGGMMGGVGSMLGGMLGKSSGGYISPGNTGEGYGAAGGSYQDYGNVAYDGAYVGGQAKVPGDSPQNDTVHAMLSPGEIVIPRSKADDPEEAKAFVEHILAQKKKRKA